MSVRVLVTNQVNSSTNGVYELPYDGCAEHAGANRVGMCAACDAGFAEAARIHPLRRAAELTTQEST